MGDNDLIADELALVPAHGDLEATIFVQTGHHVDVVVEINASVLHHGLDAGDIRAVVQLPALAQLLVEYLAGHLNPSQADPGEQIPFAFHLLPVSAAEIGQLSIHANGISPFIHQSSSNIVFHHFHFFYFYHKFSDNHDFTLNFMLYYVMLCFYLKLIQLSLNII